jgi:hypothetical protein
MKRRELKHITTKNNHLGRLQKVSLRRTGEEEERVKEYIKFSEDNTVLPY